MCLFSAVFDIPILKLIHSQFCKFTVPHKSIPLMFTGEELAK